MLHKECADGTEQDCPPADVSQKVSEKWLEETVWYGLRMWHVIFLSIGVALGFIILICCCFKFRIPRTKQEIEGDYIRRRIMRKFRKRLKAIQNQELDEMDLKKALDKIRTELKSDTESLQQSDVLSGATLSSAGIAGGPGGTYRRASQIQIDISLEDLRIQSLGLGARIALAFNRFFHLAEKKPSDGKEPDVEEGAINNSPDAGDKPTTALLSSQGATDKKEDTLNKKKAKGKVEASSSSTPGASKKDQVAKPDVKKSKGEGPSSKETTTISTVQVTTEKDSKSKKEKVTKEDKKKDKVDKDKSKTTTGKEQQSASSTGGAGGSKGSKSKKEDDKNKDKTASGSGSGGTNTAKSKK